MNSRGAFRTIAFLAAALALACASDQERREQHLGRAEGYVEEGKLKEALIELRSALQFDPKDPHTNYRIAQVCEMNGQLADAIFFYGETFRLDPQNLAAATQQAALLIFDEPDRANEILSQVLETDPSNSLAYVVRSRIAVVQNDINAALEAAFAAVELDSESPLAHLQLGKVHQARIRAMQIDEVAIPERAFQNAVKAFAKARETEDEDGQWQARFQAAKVYAAWPGHEADAEAEIRAAAALGREQGVVDREAQSLRFATQVAPRWNHQELLRWALERLVEIEPHRIVNWARLARLDQQQGRDAALVWARLLESRPDDATAHVRYSTFLQEQGDPERALAHLRDAAAANSDIAPALQAARVNTLFALRRPDEANAVVVELAHSHPDHPRTTLARAQSALAARRPEDAAQLLRALTSEYNDPEAFRLLATSERRLGNLPEALEAINRSIELSRDRGFPANAFRIRANLELDQGDWFGALLSFSSLTNNGVALSGLERVGQARALYGIGRQAAARRLLENTVYKDRGPSTPAAYLLYVEKELGSRPEEAMTLLARALEKHPDNPNLLVELVVRQRNAGRTREALEHLNAAIAGKRVSARLILERGTLLAMTGNLEGAQRDALRAFEANPNLAGATDLLAAIYRAQGKLEEAVQSFEEAAAAGALGPSSQTLLARLHLQTGNEQRALELLEQVVATGNDWPGAKNDLAYLLAKQSQELNRALELAQSAQRDLADVPQVADTLGFVQLRMGLYEPALAQFRYAAELAASKGQDHPIYHHHAGLALTELGRIEEAKGAFQQALDLDKEFGDASTALQALQARSSEAS
ncbi:MAG: tetratricopeptide repeat protein [Proteobacteria bacterium]|nr:tetratricopeptide repeat protein [Pseudomonadota bacterium]